MPAKAARTGALLLGVMVLVSAGGCARDDRTAAKACDVSYTGLTVRQGRVVDTITAVCDVRPQEHWLKAAIQFQVGDAWIELGRPIVVDDRPDQAGVDYQVSAECVEGVFRTHVHVAGFGPTGIPFEFDDVGPAASFTLVDCAR